MTDRKRWFAVWNDSCEGVALVCKTRQTPLCYWMILVMSAGNSPLRYEENE